MSSSGGISSNSSVFDLVTKTAAYTIGSSDDVVLCDTTTAPFQVLLPTAVGCGGREITIKKIDASANALTIATVAGTLDGEVSISVTIQYTSYLLVSDGANWFTLSQKVATLI